MLELNRMVATIGTQKKIDETIDAFRQGIMAFTSVPSLAQRFMAAQAKTALTMCQVVFNLT